MKKYNFWMGIIVLTLCIAGIVAILGCSDDNDNDGGQVYQPSDSDFDAAASAALGASVVTNTATMANSTTQGEVRNQIFDNGGCPLVEIDGIIGNRQLTITYDDMCNVDGIAISGTVSGSWNYQVLQGLTASLAVSDFSVENTTTNGNVQVTASINAFTGGTLTVNGEVDLTDKNNMIQNLTVYNLIANANLNLTPLSPWDDYYILDGTGTYTDIDDRSYLLDFDQVRSEFLCYFPVSGILTIKGDFFIATIDYGDGNCDNDVKITIGDVEKDINIIDWLNGIE